ncbi:MAG TPA: HAD family phosphatase [Jiangellaceae bacterium]
MVALGRAHGLLVDLDGTLLDSEPVHRAAYESFFAARGWSVDPGTYAHFVGRRGSDVFATMPGPWAGEDPDALVAEVLGKLAESNAAPVPIEGATELIRSYHAHRVPIALVTSATRAWAEYAVEEVLGARECFSALITWEDVTHGKPDPAPFRTACQALHIQPEKAVAIEDSIAGVTAAVAAGVGRVVAVTTTTNAHLLRDAGAHQVAGSLSDLISR